MWQQQLKKCCRFLFEISLFLRLWVAWWRIPTTGSLNQRVTTAALKMLSLHVWNFVLFEALGGVAEDSHHRFLQSRCDSSSFKNVVVACLKCHSFLRLWAAWWRIPTTSSFNQDVTTAALKMTSLSVWNVVLFEAVCGVAEDSHPGFFQSTCDKSSFKNVVVACLKFCYFWGCGQHGGGFPPRVLSIKMWQQQL